MYKSFAANATLIAATLLSANAYALEFGKPITLQATVTKNHAVDEKKDVQVMSIKLNAKEQLAFTSYTPRKATFFKAGSPYPTAVELGMANVPVYDQGWHGSCVTFAVTAALDALIYKEEHISQLCHLSLGKNLAEDSYLPSGWWGSFGGIVLDQVSRFGVVDKKHEKTEICGGLKAYPAQQLFEEGTGITPKAYKEVSENIFEKFYFITLLNPFDRFEKQFNDKDQAEQVLHEVKTALAHGNRVVGGWLLQLSPYCGGAACAMRNKANDTWALTDQLDLPPSYFGGHEMVITGYNDNAVAYDRKGKAHRGLLTLRNSWGDDVGDNGNYYMSYDYFKKFIMEAHVIREPKDYVY